MLEYLAGLNTLHARQAPLARTRSSMGFGCSQVSLQGGFLRAPALSCGASGIARSRPEARSNENTTT